MLLALRADEGSSVTLLCDNPDFNGQPSNAVECCGDWTNWVERRFTGDTIRAAVLAAYRARYAAETDPSGPQRSEAALSAPDSPLNPSETNHG